MDIPSTLKGVGWREVGYNMLVAAACYLAWRGISALVAREQRRSRKWLRYLWPSLMVAWGWAMLWAASFPGSTQWMGRSLDALLILFFVIDLPAATLGNALLGLLVAWPPAVQAVTASLIVWLVWYGIIRVWEQWKARNVSAGHIFYE